MTDFPQYQSIGTHLGIDYYLAESDILLVIPDVGYRDTPQSALQSADYINSYVRKVGGKNSARSWS